MSKNKKVPTMVRLKPEFRRELEIKAEQKNMSLSAFLETQLEGLPVNININVDNVNIDNLNINPTINQYYTTEMKNNTDFVDVDYEE